MTAIAPTIGRIVLFHPAIDDTAMTTHRDEPFAAQVAWVGSDGLLNLSVVDHEGHHFPRCRVPLIQEGEEPPKNSGYWCEWMSYQKQVAAGALAPTRHAPPPKAKARAKVSKQKRARRA